MTLKKSADGQQTLRRLCFLSVLVAALAAVAVKLWFHPPQASASVSHSSKPDLEVGFCDSTGHGFYREQPADQLERWDLPYDNGTHVVILWKNDKRVSGRNVSMYHVDVRTSVPVLNFFVGQFGGFPQDVCAPGGSKRGIRSTSRLSWCVLAIRTGGPPRPAADGIRDPSDSAQAREMGYRRPRAWVWCAHSNRQAEGGGAHHVVVQGLSTTSRRI